MSDRDGYDPKKPWHILMMRNERWGTVETFNDVVEVIRYVVQVPDPSRVVVRYMPGDMEGTGDGFLKEVERRMTQ